MKELLSMFIAEARKSLQKAERAGEDTNLKRFALKNLESQQVIEKALDRAQLFADSKQEDTYSAEVASKGLREAAALLLDAAHALEAAIGHPDEDVLKDAGLHDPGEKGGA